MSTNPEWAAGLFHMTLRITSGSPKRIELFHAMMTLLESDWPWKSKILKQNYHTYSHDSYIRVCDSCLGTIISSPRISPADIKAAGLQCGIKVKVDRMSEAIHCHGNKSYAPATSVAQDEGRILYQHKAQRMRVEDKYILVGNETIDEHKQMLKVIEMPTATPTLH